MLLGKMLRGLTGTPMRSRLRANNSFAEAEPEPLTLANLTTKSLTESIRTLLFGISSHFLGVVIAAAAPGLRLVDHELLHVPGAGRAALGAQAAVQADVFVLDHHAAGLEQRRHVQRLLGVARRCAQPCAQVGLVAIAGERDAVGRADVDAGIALDALAGVEDRLHVAVQAALRFLPRRLHIEAEFD